MKTKNIDKSEVARLKFEYLSECHNNNSICITTKKSDRIYKLIKKKFGITGRDPKVVMKKMDKLIK